jgi:hypothetical protein
MKHTHPFKSLPTPDLIALIQRKSTQHIQQPPIVIRLHIPPPSIQTPQIIRNIPAIALPHLKPIPQKRKHIPIPIHNLIILIPRALQHLQEMQPTARPNRRLAIRPALLEPAATRARPRGALQEQISVLAEQPRRFHPRRQRLDVFDLALCNRSKHVARPLLDERHEGAVSERPVRSAERECVGEARDSHAEVRCHAVLAAPERAQVGAVRDEGEAGEPGGVEAGCADDYVDGVLVSLVVDEAGFGDAADGVGEGGCVGAHEGFEVAWCRGGAATARVEVLGDHFLGEARVVVEFVAHFCGGVVAGGACCFGAFHDEFEALVELVFDLFAVLEVFLWVVLEELELFFAVCCVLARALKPSWETCIESLRHSCLPTSARSLLLSRSASAPSDIDDRLSAVWKQQSERLSYPLQ